MLTMITGKVGGGKSYFGVETCVTALNEGAVVHTNLDLIWDKVEERWPGQVVKLPSNPAKWIRARKPKADDPEDAPLIECDLIVGGSEGAENLVVIDEASFEFGSDNPTSKEHKDKLWPVRALVTLQRHVGIDIIFITQSKKKIDAKLREDASERIHCVKSITLPFIGWLAAPLRGDFKRNLYDQSDMYVTTTWHRFKSDIGELYNTHARRASVAMRVDPTRKVKTGESGKKGMWGMLFSIGLAAIAIIWGLTSTYKTIRGEGGPLASKSSGSSPSTENTEKAGVTPLRAPLPAVTVDAPPSLPNSHVSGLKEVSWELADEWVLAARYFINGIEVCGARGGLRLGIGLDYMGERIVEMTQYRGWRYYTTEAARVVVLRPLHPLEREHLWLKQREEIRGSKPDAKIDPIDNLASGAKEGLGL
jgi:hypothetical protein